MIRYHLRLLSFCVLMFFVASLCAPIVEAASNARKTNRSRTNPRVTGKRRSPARRTAKKTIIKKTAAKSKGGSFAKPKLLVKIPGKNVVIDLNTAGAAQLQQIPGIGKETALRLVKSRAGRGGMFRSISEFNTIKGMGSKRVGAIEKNLVRRAPSKSSTAKFWFSYKGQRVDLNNTNHRYVTRRLAQMLKNNADVNALNMARAQGPIKSNADLLARLRRMGYRGPLNGQPRPKAVKTRTRVTKLSPKASSTTPKARATAPRTPSELFRVVSRAKNAGEVYMRLRKAGVGEALAREIGKARARAPFKNVKDLAYRVKSLRTTSTGRRAVAEVQKAQLDLKVKKANQQIQKWQKMADRVVNKKPVGNKGYDLSMKQLRQIRGQLKRAIAHERALTGKSVKNLASDSRLLRLNKQIKAVEAGKLVYARQRTLAAEKAALTREINTSQQKFLNLKKSQPRTALGFEKLQAELKLLHKEMFAKVAKRSVFDFKDKAEFQRAVNRKSVMNDPRVKAIEDYRLKVRKAYLQFQKTQRAGTKPGKARGTKNAGKVKGKQAGVKSGVTRASRAESGGTKQDSPKARNPRSAARTASKTWGNTRPSPEELVKTVRDAKTPGEAYKALQKAGVEKNLAREIWRARRAGPFKNARDLAGRVKSLNHTMAGRKAIEEIKARSKRAQARVDRRMKRMKAARARTPEGKIARNSKNVETGTAKNNAEFKPSRASRVTRLDKPSLKTVEACRARMQQLKPKIKKLMVEVRRGNPNVFKNSRDVLRAARNSTVQQGSLAQLREYYNEYLRAKSTRNVLAKSSGSHSTPRRAKASETASSSRKAANETRRTIEKLRQRAGVDFNNVDSLRAESARLRARLASRYGSRGIDEALRGNVKGELGRLKSVEGRLARLEGTTPSWKAEGSRRAAVNGRPDQGPAAPRRSGGGESLTPRSGTRESAAPKSTSADEAVVRRAGVEEPAASGKGAVVEEPVLRSKASETINAAEGELTAKASETMSEPGETPGTKKSFFERIFGKRPVNPEAAAEGKRVLNEWTDMFNLKNEGVREVDIMGKHSRSTAQNAGGKDFARMILDSYKIDNSQAKEVDIFKAKEGTGNGPGWWKKLTDVFKKGTSGANSAASASFDEVGKPEGALSESGQAKASESFSPAKDVEVMGREIETLKTRTHEITSKIKSTHPDMSIEAIERAAASPAADGEFLELQKARNELSDLKTARNNAVEIAKTEGGNPLAPKSGQTEAGAPKNDSFFSRLFGGQDEAAAESASSTRRPWWKKFFKGRAESKATIAEGKAPVAEGKAPVAEGKAPVAEGKAPVVEGKAPVAEGKAPVVEGKAPVAEGKAPVVEGKAPVVDGKAPAAEGRIIENGFDLTDTGNRSLKGEASGPSAPGVTEELPAAKRGVTEVFAKAKASQTAPPPNAMEIASIDGQISRLSADSRALAKNIMETGNYESTAKMLEAAYRPDASGDLARLRDMRTKYHDLKAKKLRLADEGVTKADAAARTQNKIAGNQAEIEAAPDLTAARAKVDALETSLMKTAEQAVAKGKYANVQEALKSPEFKGKVADINSMKKALEVKAAKSTAKASETATQGEGKASAKASQTVAGDVPPAIRAAEAHATQLRARIQQLEAGGTPAKGIKGLIGKFNIFKKFTSGKQLANAKAELAKVEADIAKMKSDPGYLARKNKALASKHVVQSKLIKAIDAELAKPGLKPAYRKALEQRKAQLENTPGESFKSTMWNIALISAGTNLLFNVYHQLKEDGKVDWSKATAFLTDAKFWMSTAGVGIGAFVGQKVAMMPFYYLLSTKVAAFSPFGGLVMTLLPAFLGGAIGGHLLGGGGFQNIDWVLMIGQTLGSVLGTALVMTMFPGAGMIGQLAGAMVGGFVAEKLIEMFRGPKSEAAGRGKGADGDAVEPLPGTTKASDTFEFSKGDVDQTFKAMQDSYKRYVQLESAGRFGEAAQAFSEYVETKHRLDAMRQASFNALQK